jgi:uncharacterized membrane protein YqjE
MAQAPRTRAIHDLVAAHGELSAIEWLELKQAATAAAAWVFVAALLGLGAVLAANAAIILAFRADPLKAALGLAVGNSLAALLALWRAGALMRRPFFALTRREAAADARALGKALLS